MHSAWGKPHGTIAHVNIGQILLSIHSRDVNVPVIQEALCHACHFYFIFISLITCVISFSLAV